MSQVSKTPRIVSLLPSATEIACLVGAGKWLVGRNHEDDYPPEYTRTLPILTGQKTTFTTSADVDVQVSTALANGESLYTLDIPLLESLDPTLILTQDLCNVCAIDLQTVERVAKRMPTRPPVITLNPLDLEDVLESISVVGAAVGLAEHAEGVKQGLMGRVRDVMRKGEERLVEVGKGVRPSVLFVEWPDPLYPGGHWTPQLIHLAGAVHPVAPAPPRSTDNTNDTSSNNNSNGKEIHHEDDDSAKRKKLLLPWTGAGPSVRTPGSQVLSPNLPRPTHIIVAPCGLSLEDAKRETDLLFEGGSTDEGKKWFREIVAGVGNGYHHVNVALVDGNHHFNRPGPRLVDALEWLVEWIWNPGQVQDGKKDVSGSCEFPWKRWSPPADKSQ